MCKRFLSISCWVQIVFEAKGHKDGFNMLFRSLGNRFLARGDYNAKQVSWGWRLSPPGRRRILCEVINEMHLCYLSTYAPTYWPTDPHRVIDLLNFCVVKGIANEYLHIESHEDIMSDPTPIISAVATIPKKKKPPTLVSNIGNWEYFRGKLNSVIQFKISLNHIENSNWNTYYINPKCSLWASPHN